MIPGKRWTSRLAALSANAKMEAACHAAHVVGKYMYMWTLENNLPPGNKLAE